MSNKVYAYFATKSGEYGTKRFNVVFDSPIVDEASETLDSATIVVPNLYEQLSDIEPYQEVALEIVTDTPYPTIHANVSTTTPLQYAIKGTKMAIGESLSIGTKCFADCIDQRQNKHFYVLSKVVGENTAISLGKIFYDNAPTSISDYRRFLIDSFNETQVNVSEKTYSYTIELMSETKYLEKIQCPNLSITHSKVSGAKSILDYIELYMNLYCPKIKTLSSSTEWAYAPLITISDNVRNKFKDVPCADLSMSQPTLRQVLTSLMIQKGCIPIVRDRKLMYLDFRKDIPTYNGEVGRMTIERAMASDSYVNTLVNMASNVTDNEDNIVSESLVFRDRNNVLLKQKENLKLETRYPIYSVSNFKLNAYCNANFYVNQRETYQYRYILDGGESYFGINLITDQTTESLRIMNVVAPTGTITHTFKGYFVIKCFVCHWDNSGFVVDKEIDKTTNELTFSGTVDIPYYGDIELFKNVDYNYSTTEHQNNAFAIAKVTFHGTMDGRTADSDFFVSDAYNGFSFWTPSMFSPVRFDATTTAQRSREFDPSTGKGTNINGGWRISYLYTKDITPLIVEKSKRSQLNTDFLAMPSSFSNEYEMASWLYCTVDYTIGENTIEGFSDTYSKSNGWWDTEKTYIENIFDSLIKFDSTGESLTKEKLHDTFGGVFDGYEVGTDEMIYVAGNTIANPFFTDNSANNFSLLFFDISYIPLNSVTMRHFKDNVDLPIEQLNTSSSGITSSILLSLNQQDTINRLANDVIAIHERVPSMFDIQDCPSMWGDYTIFKRECKIGKNAIDVNYYASKNHIMKNYFTAIQTKYRAYEYVDYSKSIVRKESDVVHILVSPNGYIDGDDKLTTSNSFTLSLIDGILLIPYGAKLAYSYSGKGEEWYKNECSIYTTDSSIYFNYTQFDNGSEGIFIDGKYLDISGAYKDNPIGGIPQQWYNPDDDWQNTIEIGYIDNIGVLAPKAMYYQNSDEFVNWVRTLQAQPKFTFPTTIKNRLAVSKKVGKDLAERISYTLQLDFYCPDKSIEQSRWLFIASSAVGGRKLDIYEVWDSDEFNSIGYKDLPSGAVQGLHLTIIASSGNRFKFNYSSSTSSHTSLKFLCLGDDGLYHDMIKFNDMATLKKGYCVSYNDTKGNRVFSNSTSGILVASKTAKLTTNPSIYDRIVVED